MAIRNRALLKSWFKRGLYPKESQFADWIDSFFHKEDKIPLTAIEDLSELLNAKYNHSDGINLEKRAEKIENDLSSYIIRSDTQFDKIEEELDDVHDSIDALVKEDVAIRKELADGDVKTLDSAKKYTDTKIADVIGSAPEALDTLKELSEALGNDPNFSTTILGQIGKKVDKVDGCTLLSASDKVKIDSIEEGASKYIHPLTHPASMIEESSEQQFVTNAQKSIIDNAALKDLSNVTEKHLRGTGYYKFPDGLLIQWGTIFETISTPIQKREIFLPLRFTNSTYTVYTTLYSDKGDCLTEYMISGKKVESFYTMGLYYNPYDNTHGFPQEGFFWLAIGLWA